MAFVPDYAPLVVLAFLGTGFLLGLLGVVFFCAALCRHRTLAAWTFGLGAVVVLSYGGLLVVLALVSPERTLAPGEWKYFCEIDCHLAYRVESVSTAKTLGTANAQGTFYVVTLKAWFDEHTIASWRPRDLPLTPGRRQLALVDERDRVFGVSEAGERALAAAGTSGTPLTQPLKPGESYTTTLVFDLPANARAPRLLLVTVGAPTYFLLGHENSFFHRKVYFSLEP